jgi:phage terminase large subunit
MSSEYDMIYVQEAIELSVTGWEHASSRLRNGRMPYQQIIADTNPSTPTHWLKQRCNRGDTRILESRHTDNPVLYDDEGALTERGAAYMKILDRLTGPRRLRLKDGLWVAAEGQIFEQFDESVHVIDPFEIPRSWRRVWSIDFGFTHPFVLQCWAIDPDGRAYLYREIYHTGRLVEEHAEQIMSLVSTPDPGYVHRGTSRRRAYQGRIWTEPKPQAIVCDHDAEGRATFEREVGMPTRAAQKAVTDGLQAVQSRLKRAGDGRPRLFLLRGALVERDKDLALAMKPTSTVEEIPGYIWSNHKTKDEPVKAEDDGCDGLRYFVMDQDRRKGSGIRHLG